MESGTDVSHFQSSGRLEWSKPARHHDFIDPEDFPECWRGLNITVEVEAKAKELAVLKLQKLLSEQWYTYIVQCSDESYYTGVTTDPERRVRQHNAGTGARYTRARRPVALVFQEAQPGRGAALRRELQIKALNREAKTRLILQRQKSDSAQTSM
ncbi:MAG: GIY-YIG nuclease family protein [Planctomycetaceae bacterium]